MNSLCIHYEIDGTPYCINTGRRFRGKLAGELPIYCCDHLVVISQFPPCPLADVVRRLRPDGVERLQMCRTSGCKILKVRAGIGRCLRVGGSQCQQLGNWVDFLNGTSNCPIWTTVMQHPSYREQMSKRTPTSKPSKPKGLGDLIEGALSKVGITHDRVGAWLGRPCGCAERKRRLNRLFSWARSIEETPPEEAAAKVEEIFSS